MKYSITRLILGYTPEIIISEEEYKAIKEAKELLSEGLAIEEKYQVLLDNYEDFEKEIVNRSTESMLRPPQEYNDFQVTRAAFNKRIINLLTTSRLYIDHVQKHHIGEIISYDGREKVKELFSNRYDQYFEYRFIEALRNHVQHRGFPAHHIQFHSFIVDPDATETRIVHTIEIASEKKFLQEDKKFKKSVLEEMDERIDFKKAIRKYMECLSEIQTEVRNLISAKLSDARSLISEYIERYKKEIEEKTNGLVAIIKNDDGIKIDAVYMLLDWDDIRIKLENRNRVLKNLMSRYVSGEIK